MKSMTVFEMELYTLTDLIDTVQLCADDDDAVVFIEAYAALCGEQVATHNLRYMFQRIASRDDSEAERLSDLFMVERTTARERIEPLHVFGRNAAGEIVPPRPVTSLVYDGCLCCREQTHKPRPRQVERSFQAASSAPRRTSKLKIEKKPMKRKMLTNGDMNGGMLP